MNTVASMPLTPFGIEIKSVNSIEESIGISAKRIYTVTSVIAYNNCSVLRLLWEENAYEIIYSNKRHMIHLFYHAN